MEFFPKKAVLRLLFVCSILCTMSCQRNGQRKDELIQDTVRKFLGVKSEERPQVAGKAQNVPPRYMMDLYERYRSGQTPMQGNTVRSILAMRDTIADADMLIFNLTGLKSTEQILQSKLYLLKRQKRKGRKKREHSSFRLNIGCLPNMTSLHHIDISLARQKSEWHSYDISESVVSCRQSRKGQESLLGLTLEVKRSRGRHRLVSFKRIVKKSSQPFVLIFSEDSQNQTNILSTTKQEGYDEIRDLLRLKANGEGMLPSEFRLPEPSTNERRHREKRSIQYNDNKLDEINPNYVENYIKVITKNFNNSPPSDLVKFLRTAVEKVRHALSVYKPLDFPREIQKSMIVSQRLRTNRLPKDDLSTFDNSTSNKAFSKVLLLRERGFHDQNSSALNRYKRGLADTLRYSAEGMESHESTVKTIEVISEKSVQENNNIHPKSDMKRRKWKMHKNHRKRKRKGKNRKIPFWWTKHDSRLHAEDKRLLCRRKSLTVDFSQIGWDDWIISPKSFNSHYCEGSCTFPIIKHTDTSNHAAVQSLIHALQIKADIPTPSCVPSATSSLTLLYFDEHGSLVMKSYPNMIVDKCGCR